jgi:predicted nucleic acid-binding Zn ribbon protein
MCGIATKKVAKLLERDGKEKVRKQILGQERKRQRHITRTMFGAAAHLIQLVFQDR